MAASTTCARTLLIALAGVLVLATVFVSVQDEVFAGHRTVSGVQQHQQLQQHRLRSIGELPYPASPASLVPTSRHSRTATQPPTAVAGIDQIPTLTKPAAATTTAAAASSSLSQPQPAELPKVPLTVIDYSDEPKEASGQYWERRYAKYGFKQQGSVAAAKFKVKALVVNTLLDKLHIADAVEFGLGDARMLRMIKYGRYTGLDVIPSVVRYNTDKFAEDSSKSFVHYNSMAPPGTLGIKAELGVSLEVIYFLTEGRVFENYMRHLFASSTRYVLVLSSNTETASSDMHVGGITPAHIRHWVFVRYALSWFAPQWRLVGRLPWPFPHMVYSDFYLFCAAGEACDMVDAVLQRGRPGAAGSVPSLATLVDFDSLRAAYAAVAQDVSRTAALKRHKARRGGG